MLDLDKVDYKEVIDYLTKNWGFYEE
jgi:hypothetical protein